uniref:Uncharacterized protein n=1 Tax=Acrobeloides nanus TaxID=290746 RepID=A0A914CU77_9BILA
MQLMLYNSVLIQGWNFIVLILTSVGLICMFVVLEIRKTAIMVQLLIAFMEIHGVSDLCFIMYFITPYRRYIKEKIFCRKKPNQVIPKQLTTTMPATVIVKPR